MWFNLISVSFEIYIKGSMQICWNAICLHKWFFSKKCQQRTQRKQCRVSMSFCLPDTCCLLTSSFGDISSSVETAQSQSHSLLSLPIPQLHLSSHPYLLSWTEASSPAWRPWGSQGSLKISQVPSHASLLLAWGSFSPMRHEWEPLPPRRKCQQGPVEN